MENKEINQIVDEIRTVFADKGHLSYGEQITQLEHMVQSGHLAMEEGHDDEVVIAAFLHDIGHLCATDGEERMGEFGIQRHDQIGANFLRRRGFSEKIATLVEGHVEAKRYLTFKYPEYLEKLSEASTATLAHQGGPMKAEEAAAFEASPLFDLCIKMREWDDAGKRTDLDLSDLSPFFERIERYLNAA